MIHKQSNASVVSRYILACFAAVINITPTYTQAAPTGGDLLTACRHSLENGFETVEGQMCAWYVIPCDCDPSLPKVCLSETPDTATLAREVIDGLAVQTELLDEHAALAAARILSNKYTCP